METFKIIMACLGAIMLAVMLLEILFRPSEAEAFTKAVNLMKDADKESIRERGSKDYIKAKEKAAAAYDAKLAESDYKEIEDILKTMTAALNPLVEKRHKIIEEAAAEYKRVMDEERIKSREKFKCPK